MSSVAPNAEVAVLFAAASVEDATSPEMVLADAARNEDAAELSPENAATQAVANAAKRVFVLAAAAVFLGEVPSARKIVGSCVALLGVLGYGLSKRDAAKKNR